LEPAEREAYLGRYTAGIAKLYPAQADGRVLLPFPRFFFVGVRR
jgi:trans-aconitate 2-methyltransferase